MTLYKEDVKSEGVCVGFLIQSAVFHSGRVWQLLNNVVLKMLVMKTQIL